jgi:cyclophilin family peptidyl-prolyl cis-trans isomerase
MDSETRVFLDVQIGDYAPKRIVIRLFTDMCPKTCESFRALCTGELGTTRSGHPLFYQDVPFHRVIRRFMMQGGDFENKDGTGGESIYGGKMKDENFAMKHDRRGLLCMANSGPDTNGSQFFILFAPAPHLDGKHVVFGEVISGMDVVTEVEELPTGAHDRPTRPVVIARSSASRSLSGLQQFRQSRPRVGSGRGRVAANFFWQNSCKFSLVFGCIGTDLRK